SWTRSYEFESEREAARYASSLIVNNADVAASFQNLTARARKNAGNRFHISSAQVVTQSEEVTRYHASTGPGVSLLQTFWVFFGIMEGHTKGNVVSESVIMQIEGYSEQ